MLGQLLGPPSLSDPSTPLADTPEAVNRVADGWTDHQPMPTLWLADPCDQISAYEGDLVSQHEHWTYTLPGGYTSPFYSPTFEGAAVTAFRHIASLEALGANGFCGNSQTVHVFNPSGPGVDVTREEAVAMAAVFGEEL